MAPSNIRTVASPSFGTSSRKTNYATCSTITVIKNGNATGVTIGRGISIESFVREYDDYGIRSISIEIAIYPYKSRG